MKEDDPSKTVEWHMANCLAGLRLEQGITLKELGAKVELSSAYLSRVENHKASITIANLSKLAGALGVSISTFFQEDQAGHQLTFCQAGEGKVVHVRGAASIKAEVLAWEKLGKLMEPIVVDIGSARLPMEVWAHPGEEFNYILEGECEFIYAKERFHLVQGDAVYYDATVPHAVHNNDNDKSCKVLSIVASKDYLFHGDLNRLLND